MNLPAELEMPEPKRVALSGINYAPYNPRVMPPEEMESLKASLVKHGMVLNLVVQREADDATPLVLIGGHQRIRALRAICEENDWALPADTWATVLDVDDAKAKQLNIALNKISGSFDFFMLGEMLADLELTDEEERAIGFTHEQIDALVAESIGDTDDLADALEGSVGDLQVVTRPHTHITVQFSDADQRAKAKTLLASAAEKLSTQSEGAALVAVLEDYCGGGDAAKS